MSRNFNNSNSRNELNTSFDEPQLGKQDYYKQKAEREIKSFYDEKVKEIKGQQEGRLSSMREDIQKKEREVQDLKNQLNLINLRLTKENESRSSVEDALNKNNNRFSSDVEKYTTSLKSANQDNESLVFKLQETDKNVQNANLEKRQVEVGLQGKTSELEDARRRYSEENEDKNARISQLHLEVKSLQEKLNDLNVKGAMLEGKNSDVAGNYERNANQSSESIVRLKSEFERLSGENVDMLAKLSRIANELENAKVKIDKQKYENNFEVQKATQDIEDLQARIRSATGFQQERDDSLKNNCRIKYEEEVKAKDLRADLEQAIADIKFHNNKATSEGDELKRKIEHTTKLYEEAYTDNEKILRDFDEFKRHQNSLNLQKDNEINSLKSETQQAENKIKEASEKIRNLDARIFDGDNLYKDTKTRSSNDINAVIERHSALKVKQDDMCIELRSTLDRLNDKDRTNTDLDLRTKNMHSDLMSQINASRAENQRREEQAAQLNREGVALSDKISSSTGAIKNNENEQSNLAKKHEQTVNTLTGRIKKLEQDYQTQSKLKEELERAVHNRGNESRNLQFDAKFAKEESVKRESLLSEKLNTLEHNLMREKDNYRQLAQSNNELISSQDETSRNKENLLRQICELREKEVEIEAKIRKTEEEFAKRDSHEVVESCNLLGLNRRDAAEDLREMARKLDECANHLVTLNDANHVEDTTTTLREKMTGLDGEVGILDSKVKSLAKENMNSNLDVDHNRKVRAEFEASTLNLNDLKVLQDGVLLDHSKDKSEQQTLDRQLREAKNDLQTTVDKKQTFDRNVNDQTMRKSFTVEETMRNSFSADRNRFNGSIDRDRLGYSNRKDGLTISNRKDGLSNRKDRTYSNQKDY